MTTLTATEKVTADATASPPATSTPACKRPAIATAPARIYLQISDDESHYGEPFPGEHSEQVTWCSEPALACEVPYVRADLASASAQ